MTTVSQSLYDSLKHVVESLQARFLLPSIILVVGTILILEIDFKFLSPERTSLLICIVITISYLFNALNGLIIRLMEGYEFKDNLLYRYMKKKQKCKRDKLLKQISECESDLVDLVRYEEDLQCDPPSNLEELMLRIEEAQSRVKNREAQLLEIKNAYFASDSLLPTPLGNVIKSFEEYPMKRYGMDSVNLWPRMFNILQKEGFLSVIQNEKITLDFLANTGFVTIIFFLEILYSFAFLNHSPLLLIALCVTLFICYLLFYSTVAVAQDWGRLVCCAFDLYREDLRIALKLPPIPSNDLDAEKEIWKAASHLIIYGNLPPKAPFKGFVYQGIQKKSEVS